MYKIEKTDFGYKLTFEGVLSADEIKKWVEETKEILSSETREFGVFIDMRALRPLSQDVQPYMQEGQMLYKSSGMQRSVVILEKAITKIQFKRIAKETGIYKYERYVATAEHSNWEQTGLDWIKKSIDPDL